MRWQSLLVGARLVGVRDSRLRWQCDGSRCMAVELRPQCCHGSRCMAVALRPRCCHGSRCMAVVGERAVSSAPTEPRTRASVLTAVRSQAIAVTHSTARACRNDEQAARPTERAVSAPTEPRTRASVLTAVRRSQRHTVPHVRAGTTSRQRDRPSGRSRHPLSQRPLSHAQEPAF